jgi:O-antigen ligase
MPSKTSRHIRIPGSYRICDGFSEAIIYFIVIFNPWAFGTTQAWSIWTVNIASYGLGFLLFFKWIIKKNTGFHPSRWDEDRGHLSEEEFEGRKKRSRLISRIALCATGVIWIWCVVSWINARAEFHFTFDIHQFRFEYFEDSISWLPHTYAKSFTEKAVWEYLGYALFFWALRDWLLGKTWKEVKGVSRKKSGFRPEPIRQKGLPSFIPGLSSRTHRLLWVLCINGALVALEGILQRLSGSDKLLWMVQPTINKLNLAQFGPYAYRSSAAQFFNLIWPICLGFWWLLFKKANFDQAGGHRIGKSPYPILMPCAVLMAAAPIISTSRGGAVVSVIMMLMSLGILVLANRGGSRLAAYSVITIMMAALGMAGYLGWDNLEKRLERVFDDNMGGREALWDQSKEIIGDYPYWGTGPKSFGAVYQLYTQPMRSDAHIHAKKAQAYAHNDWLELVISFGLIGSPLFILLLIYPGLYFLTGTGFFSNWEFPGFIAISMFGCLFHAIGDMPFQIHSVATVFLVAMCVLSCTSRQ